MSETRYKNEGMEYFCTTANTILFSSQPTGFSSTGNIDRYRLAALFHSSAIIAELGPLSATRRPVFIICSSSPMIKRASSNRSNACCAFCASLGTVSLRNRSTDSMSLGSFLSWFSTSRKEKGRSLINLNGACVHSRERTCGHFANLGSCLPQDGRYW